MSEPIDIKTKKFFIKPALNKFNETYVFEALEKNILVHWSSWSQFQQVWANQAFKTFRDFDKYVLLVYLIRDYFQKLSDKFEYYSYDDFYNFEFITISKLNLIKIANELNIPKETVRRKVNELQSDGILSRNGKDIVLRRKLLGYQRPEAALDALSSFINKKSIILQGQSWFGNAIEKKEIIIYIKKYFTILWLSFLKVQIPFLLRHRANFSDLETWMIWGNVAMHHQKSLNQFIDNSVEVNHIHYKNYYKKITDLKVNRGVNASSIADISNIPRATVIRKLRWLVKNKMVKKNKQLEYILQSKGKLNKKVEESLEMNLSIVAEFLTNFFDYYKNSNFKP